MKKTNEITQKLSFVYYKKQNAIYLKSVINKKVNGHITYDQVEINGSGVNYEIIYKKKPQTGIAGNFTDSLEIKLSILVKSANEVTDEKLRTIIRDYLSQYGYNARFKLNAIFNEADGSIEGSNITGISEDADIDLIE